MSNTYPIVVDIDISVDGWEERAYTKFKNHMVLLSGKIVVPDKDMRIDALADEILRDGGSPGIEYSAYANYDFHYGGYFYDLEVVEDDWYIIVKNSAGGTCYEGWSPNSQDKNLKEALVEAITGAQSLPEEV